MDLFEIVKTNKIQKKDCTELQSHTYSHLQHSVVGNDISKSCPLSQHHHDWYQSNQFTIAGYKYNGGSSCSRGSRGTPRTSMVNETITVTAADALKDVNISIYDICFYFNIPIYSMLIFV